MKKSKVIAALFATAVMAVSAVPAGAYAESTSVTIEAQVPSAKKDISKCYVVLSGDIYIYFGSEVKPWVNVYQEYLGSDSYAGDLEEGKDFTVTYKNNKSIGTASVVIKGKGKYTGTQTIKYNIVPVNPDTPKVTSKNGKITLSWNKVDEASKYRIYYSVNGGEYKKLADTDKCKYTTTKLDTKNVTYTFSVSSIAKVKNKSYINKSIILQPAIIQNGSFAELNNVKMTAERKDNKISSITITGLDFDSYAKKVKGSKPWGINIGLCPTDSFWTQDYINIIVDSKGISSCSYAGENLDYTYDAKTKTMNIDVKNSEIYNYFFNGLNGNFTNMCVIIKKPKKANSDKYEIYCEVGSFKATEENSTTGYGGYSKMTIDWPQKAES